MTPLFPQNTPLSIKQGKFGDCFLLAALLCIHKSEKGRQFLESLFEKKNGNIIVRLAHSTQSVHLQPRAFKNKYCYYVDEKAGKDVFIIPPSTLTEIDTSPEGVVSNSLAVKILERLVSHYYEFKWNRRQRRGSLYAHNHTATDRYPSHATSSHFLSKVLGIAIDTSLDIEQAIKLKRIYPEQAIYFSMADHSKPEDSSRGSSRHAFMLEQISINEDAPETSVFILVNPWGKEKTKKIDLSIIRQNDSRYVVYITDPTLHQQLKYSIQTPKLFDLICEAKHVCPLFTGPDFIKQFSQLYSDISYLPDILASLTREEACEIYTHICLIPENKDRFICALLSKFSHVWLAKIIIRNETNCASIVNRKIAGIALQEKNNALYNHLLGQRFDFTVFLSESDYEINSFFEIIIDLETSNKEEGNSKLKRILHYINRMNAHKTLSQANFPISRGVIRPATERALQDLKVTQAELIVSTVITKINFFHFSFDTCQSKAAVFKHRKKLFNELEKMLSSPDLKEAYQALDLKNDEHHPTVLEAINTKKRSIDQKEAEVPVKTLKRKSSYPQLLFSSEVSTKSTNPSLFPMQKKTCSP